MGLGLLLVLLSVLAVSTSASEYLGDPTAACPWVAGSIVLCSVNSVYYLIYGSVARPLGPDALATLQASSPPQFTTDRCNPSAEEQLTGCRTGAILNAWPDLLPSPDCESSGNALYVNGLKLCIGRQDKSKLGHDPAVNMTVQWVSYLSCEGQTVFEVANKSPVGAISNWGIQGDLKATLGPGAKLVNPESYNYYTPVSNTNATGTFTFTNATYYTGPGQKSQFAFTLSCFNELGYAGAGENCPCPPNSLPMRFTLADGSLGTGSPASACKSTADPATTWVSRFPEAATTYCYSPPVRVTPDDRVSNIPKDAQWIDDFGNCFDQTWYNVTNQGLNVITNYIDGRIHVTLPAGRFLGQPGSTSYSTDAVVGATEFDIYNFAGQMNPRIAPMYSYFALVTYCTTCPCPAAASVDQIVFSGASLSAVQGTAPYPPFIQPLSVHNEVGGTVDPVCVLDTDTSVSFTWSTGSAATYSPDYTATLAMYPMVSLNAPDQYIESFVYTSAPRIRLEGVLPATAGGPSALANSSYFLSVFNKYDPSLAAVALSYQPVAVPNGEPGLVLPGTCTFAPFQPDGTPGYIAAPGFRDPNANTWIDNSVLCFGVVRDMLEDVSPRLGAADSLRVYAIRVQHGYCYPPSADALSQTPVPTPSCTKVTICVQKQQPPAAQPADLGQRCYTFGNKAVQTLDASATFTTMTDPTSGAINQFITRIKVYQSMTAPGMPVSGLKLLIASDAVNHVQVSLGDVTSSFYYDIVPPTLDDFHTPVVGWFKVSETLSSSSATVCSIEPVWVAQESPDPTTATVKYWSEVDGSW